MTCAKQTIMELNHSTLFISNLLQIRCRSVGSQPSRALIHPGLLTYQVDNALTWDPACFSALGKARRTENPAQTWPSGTDFQHPVTENPMPEPQTNSGRKNFFFSGRNLEQDKGGAEGETEPKEEDLSVQSRAFK